MKPSRRDLIAGASAAALAVSAKAADAAGFLFLAAPAGGGGGGGGGNGGKSVMNFNFLNDGGEYPFLNMIKGCTPWSFFDNFGANGGNGAATPGTDDLSHTYIDANGYPLTKCVTDHGGVQGAFYIPPSSEYSGNYRVQFTCSGSATIIFAGDSTTTVTTVSATNIGGNTYQQTISNPSPNGGRIQLKITQNTTDDLNNLSFVNVNETTSFDGGEVFTSQFKTRLTNAKIGVLRFMNWQGIGGSLTCSVAHWADRKPQGYVYYHGDEKKLSIWGGITDTNLGTDQYNVSAPSGFPTVVSGVPADKSQVIVRFNVANVGFSPTLRVTGGPGGTTNDIVIKRPDGLAFSSGNTSSQPKVNGVGILTYDADLACWLLYGGGGNANLNRCMDNGIPPETGLALAKELSMNAWFTAPYLTCDPPTDWLSSLVSYEKANKAAWQTTFFEVTPNESWQTGNIETQYGFNKSAAHWGSGTVGTSDIDDWVGLVASTGAQTVCNGYSVSSNPDGTKFRTICGVQALGAGNGGPTNPYTTKQARVESSAWLNDTWVGITPQTPTGYSRTAAKEYLTDICLAHYFRHTLPTSSSTISAISGTVSGTTLTVASVTGDVIGPGTQITFNDASTAYIVAYGSGSGSAGTYTLATTPSGATISSADNTYNQAVAAYQATQAVAIPQAVVDSTNVLGTDSQHFQGAANFVSNVFAAWVAWCGAHKSSTSRAMRLIAYEGGWECNGGFSGGNSDANHQSMSVVTQTISSLSTYLTNVYNAIVTAGGAFPACFQMAYTTFNLQTTLTGSISSKTLTVTNGGTPNVGALITGSDVTTGTVVTGVGVAGTTYYVSQSQTASGIAHFANPIGSNPWGVAFPDNYAAESVQWNAIAAFNGGT